MAAAPSPVVRAALLLALAPCRPEAAYCPPVGAGPCLREAEPPHASFLVAETRLAGTLDFLLEVHDFHCGDHGRRSVRATFTWFEDLRLAACALRYHACPSMDVLYRAQCRRADARRGDVEALAPGAFRRKEGGAAPAGACDDLAGAVFEAAEAGVKLGRQLPLAAEPCPLEFADGLASPLLLYPVEHSPGGICAVDELLFPLRGASSRFASWHDITGHLVRGKFLGFDEAFRVLQQAKGRTLIGGNATDAGRWVVNLGANDGACEAGAHFDPANCLALQGTGDFTGVFVEGDPKAFGALEARVALQRQGRPRHRLVRTFVAPDTVVEVIAAELPTSEPFLLKVDVDNSDCTLVRRLLEVFSPLFVHAEINPLLPPPLVLRSAFDRAAAAMDEAGRLQRLQRSHAAGCSLAALLEDANARRPPGAGPEAPAGARPYELLHVDFANAALVRTDVLAALRARLGSGWASTLPASAEAKWRAGYLCHPLARHLFGLEWAAGCDVRAFADPQEPPERRLALVQEWLAQVANGSTSPGDYELYLAAG